MCVRTRLLPCTWRLAHTLLGVQSYTPNVQKPLCRNVEVERKGKFTRCLDFTPFVMAIIHLSSKCTDLCKFIYSIQLFRIQNC